MRLIDGVILISGIKIKKRNYWLKRIGLSNVEARKGQLVQEVRAEVAGARGTLARVAPDRADAATVREGVNRPGQRSAQTNA